MIKRFNPDFSLSISHELAYMRETPEGGYVAHGDYATLFSELELVKAERDALLAELEAKDKHIITVIEEREFWRERVEGAEKEREEFRRRFNLERTYTEDADKRIAELEVTQMTGPIALVLERTAVLERITEGVDQLAIDGGWTARGMSEYVKSLEAKLATPVDVKKLTVIECQEVSGQSREYCEGWCAANDWAIHHIRSAGFTVEGDA